MKSKQARTAHDYAFRHARKLAKEEEKINAAIEEIPGILARSPLIKLAVHRYVPDALTPTESAVAVLVADGKTNSEIAGVLHLASGTVKNYVSVILQKVHLTNRAALAVYATTHNLRADVVNTYQAEAVSYDPDCYRDLAFLAYV